MNQRPTPEAFLKRAHDEARQQQHGKLKIYLGAAPGVGKTYTMLQDALAQRAQGLDVVVGIVESHHRQEIENLLEGLEIIPRQKVSYHGQELSEFDLDGALKRNPGLILIDEMAHTNVPGLRHSKRWQDIKEILERGADVYTTLNVQHIESISDIVAQIIHAPIKETIPDSMLELADSIELVDLPPEDLLKRLQEGKVYFKAQAALAKEHFFRKGNLSALRELALRTTAERVSTQVLSYRQDQGIKYIWPSNEKILVCIDADPISIKLIRAARRMAAFLSADWIAIHVNTPKAQLSEETHNSAIQYLRLAEQLGAQTRVLTGLDAVEEIINFAREQNITRIILAKRIRSRLNKLFFPSLEDEIIRHSGEIDIYIIAAAPEEHKPHKNLAKPFIKFTSPWKTYALAFGVVVIATFLNVLLFPSLQLTNIMLIYLLAISAVTWSGRLGATIVATVLSTLSYYFFFVPLKLFPHVEQQILYTLALLLIISGVMNQLAILPRRQAETARLAEQHTSALYMLSRQLATTRGVDKLLHIAVRYISEVFDGEVLALLSEKNHLTVRASYLSEPNLDPNLNPKDLGVAQWVFDFGQMAGLGTDTLPFADAIYVPLATAAGNIGVLKVKPLQPRHLFNPQQMQLLQACADQIALALEVDRAPRS